MSVTSTRRQAKDALFDAFATVARALASGRRVEIIELLAQGERGVEQVAAAIDQTVANTSHHLRSLARAGLVTTRRAGTHVHYRLASNDVLELWWAMRRVAAEQVENLDALARAYLGDRKDVESITKEELLARLQRGEVVLVDVAPSRNTPPGICPARSPSHPTGSTSSTGCRPTARSWPTAAAPTASMPPTQCDSCKPAAGVQSDSKTACPNGALPAVQSRSDRLSLDPPFLSGGTGGGSKRNASWPGRMRVTTPSI